MYLKIYKPYSPTLRNRKKILSALSNIKPFKVIHKFFFKQKIRYCHKFTKTLFVNKINLNFSFYISNFIILNYFKTSYSNNFLCYSYHGDNSISIKPLNYGFKFNKIYKNSFTGLVNSFKIKKKKGENYI